MRFIKSLLKYIGFFVLGVVVSAFVAATTVSYYAIENLSYSVTPEKTLPPVINPNIQEVSRIGEQYRQELNLFDQLAEEVAKREPPKICKVVCNPSALDQEKVKAERSAYLLDYYRQNGKRAFEDPQFRLKLEEVGFLSELFPQSLRRVFSAADQLRTQKPAFITKLALAMHLEVATVREVASLHFRWDKIKKNSDDISTLRKIVHSCQRGTLPPKKAIAECESQIIN